MSSTNRGAKRQKFDYYATDEGQIRLFLNEWFHDDVRAWRVLCDPQAVILDPCAGGNKRAIDWQYKPGEDDGIIHVPPTRMAYPSALRAVLGTNPRIITNDIRPDSPAEFHNDFLEVETGGKAPTPDLVITNPPFSIAMEVIRMALQVVRPGGWVVMLLRLNFFGSNKRFSFFQEHAPERAYIHHERMSFTPDGKTDSIEYCHMCFQQGRNENTTLTRVI